MTVDINKAIYGRKYSSHSESIHSRFEINKFRDEIKMAKLDGVFDIQVANPSNLFDNVGYLHNLACEFYISSHTPQSTSTNSIIAVMSTFLDQTFGFENIETKIRDKFEFTLNLVLGDSSPNFNTPDGHMVDGAIILDKHNVRFLNSVLRRLQDDLNGATSLKDVLRSLDQVKREEKTIIADCKLNIDQKFLMLASTSVMRHSTYFWYSLQSNTTNPWTSRPVIGEYRIPNWLAADAVGAYTANQISLSATGAAAGTAFFGVGAAAGYFGTMAAVGAGCSLLRSLG